MENDNELLWTLEGPFGCAECFLVDKRFVLYFEPFGNEGEYIKPMLIGTYDDLADVDKAAEEVTGTAELDKVDVSEFFVDDSDADNIQHQQE